MKLSLEQFKNELKSLETKFAIEEFRRAKKVLLEDLMGTHVSKSQMERELQPGL